MKFSKVLDKKARELRHIILHLFSYKCNVSSIHHSNSNNTCYQSSHFATWISKVQQRHNLLAYIIYMYSTLSLQCIIGRFSTLAVSAVLWTKRDFWSIFLVTKAKQDQSDSFFCLICVNDFLIDFLRRLKLLDRFMFRRPLGLLEENFSHPDS